VGAVVLANACGPCIGQWRRPAFKKGDVNTIVTTFNRNWQNRMGLGGQGYLASPSVVAASALLGYIAPPAELGLEWHAEAGRVDPITGDAFHALVASQDVTLQEFLRGTLSERDGLHVIGPLDPLWERDDAMGQLFRMVRVIAVDGDALEDALSILDGVSGITSIGHYGSKPYRPLTGFRGAIVSAVIDRHRRSFMVTTAQQARWLIWLRDACASDSSAAGSESFQKYSMAVSDHLRAIDWGRLDDEAPDASSLGVPMELSLYAPRPPYVIEGYANYKAFLFSHEEIRTDFTRAITAFVPTDSLLESWKSEPPEMAFPNKEAPLIQYEFRKFFERGGNISAIHTLTPHMLQTLESGEYFFAVGLSGRIRFGFEMPREEVDRIERTSGRKVPRANHAYLFPGEAILTAGAFFVDNHGEAKIVAVNAQSGHYFYAQRLASAAALHGVGCGALSGV
ncbi:MAG: hypothetical protein IH939_14670, partial [Acidobacteria bacterium]|nr:hypothetical protein [Acidobacteriota bacterium]